MGKKKRCKLMPAEDAIENQSAGDIDVVKEEDVIEISQAVEENRTSVEVATATEAASSAMAMATMVNDAKVNPPSKADTTPKESTISPYASIPVVMNIGPGNATYYVPKHLLKSSSWLERRDGATEREITLPGLSADTGHTFVHYLYTGEYETLEQATGNTTPRLRIAFRQAVLTYRAAVDFGLSGLEELAKKKIEENGDNMEITEVFNTIRKDFSNLSSSFWFLGYLREKAETAFKDDHMVFTTDLFHDSLGKGTLNKFMMRYVVQLLSEKLINMLKEREDADKQCLELGVTVKKYHDLLEDMSQERSFTPTDHPTFDFPTADCESPGCGNGFIEIGQFSPPNCSLPDSPFEEIPTLQLETRLDQEVEPQGVEMKMGERISEAPQGQDLTFERRQDSPSESISEPDSDIEPTSHSGIVIKSNIVQTEDLVPALIEPEPEELPRHNPFDGLTKSQKKKLEEKLKDEARAEEEARLKVEKEEAEADRIREEEEKTKGEVATFPEQKEVAEALAVPPQGPTDAAFGSSNSTWTWSRTGANHLTQEPNSTGPLPTNPGQPPSTSPLREASAPGNDFLPVHPELSPATDPWGFAPTIKKKKKKNKAIESTEIPPSEELTLESTPLEPTLLVESEAPKEDDPWGSAFSSTLKKKKKKKSKANVIDDEPILEEPNPDAPLAVDAEPLLEEEPWGSELKFKSKKKMKGKAIDILSDDPVAEAALLESPPLAEPAPPATNEYNPWGFSLGSSSKKKKKDQAIEVAEPSFDDPVPDAPFAAEPKDAAEDDPWGFNLGTKSGKKKKKGKNFEIPEPPPPEESIAEAQVPDALAPEPPTPAELEPSKDDDESGFAAISPKTKEKTAKMIERPDSSSAIPAVEWHSSSLAIPEPDTMEPNAEPSQPAPSPIEPEASAPNEDSDRILPSPAPIGKKSKKVKRAKIPSPALPPPPPAPFEGFIGLPPPPPPPPIFTHADYDPTPLPPAPPPSPPADSANDIPIEASAEVESSLCPERSAHLLEGSRWKTCERCRAMLREVAIQLAKEDGEEEKGVERILLGEE